MATFLLPNILYKEVAPSTLRQYRYLLNRLARKGFTNCDMIWQDQGGCIAVIEQLTGNRAIKRMYISAILYAMSNSVMEPLDL